MVLDRPHPVIKDPYTDSSQPIPNTTLHKNNMFHKPRNPRTALVLLEFITGKMTLDVVLENFVKCTESTIKTSKYGVSKRPLTTLNKNNL